LAQETEEAMIDEEKLEADMAEAIGKATASLCLNAAMVAALVAGNAISREDVATLAAAATAALQATPELSPGAKMIGEAALRGLSSSWIKLVPRN
jgi:hypothetical protein